MNNIAKTELAEFIATFVMNSRDTVILAYERDDISIIEDEAYEYLENCE